MKKIILPNLKNMLVKGKLYGTYRRQIKGAVYEVALKAEYGSQEWMDEYYAAKKSFETGEVKGSPYGSLGWLIEHYIKTPEFKQLKPNTRKDYMRSCDYLKKTKAKNKPFAAIKKKDVKAIRDHLQKIPSKANKIVRMISILADHAITQDLRRDNPAKGVGSLRMGKGHRSWHDEELWWFDGTTENPTLRIAYFLGLFTGQRESDVLNMVWTGDTIKDGMIKVIQEKTGEDVYIPIHPILLDELKAAPRKGLHIVSNERGFPYTPDGFRSVWYKAMRENGLGDSKPTIGCTFHGLRANAATALADAGCDKEEIKSITGHKTDEMVGRYTRAARKKLVANRAMRKLTNK